MDKRKREKPDRNNRQHAGRYYWHSWDILSVRPSPKKLLVGLLPKSSEAVTAEKSSQSATLTFAHPLVLRRGTVRYVCMYSMYSTPPYRSLHARRLTLSRPRRIALPRAALPADRERRKAVPAAGRAACGVGAREGFGQMMRRADVR